MQCNTEYCRVNEGKQSRQTRDLTLFVRGLDVFLMFVKPSKTGFWNAVANQYIQSRIQLLTYFIIWLQAANKDYLVAIHIMAWMPNTLSMKRRSLTCWPMMTRSHLHPLLVAGTMPATTARRWRTRLLSKPGNLSITQETAITTTSVLFVNSLWIRMEAGCRYMETRLKTCHTAATLSQLSMRVSLSSVEKVVSLMQIFTVVITTK